MAKPVVISLFWLNAPVATLAGYHFDTSLPPAACNEKASARPTFIGSLFELIFESCACFDQDELEHKKNIAAILIIQRYNCNKRIIQYLPEVFGSLREPYAKTPFLRFSQCYNFHPNESREDLMQMTSLLDGEPATVREMQVCRAAEGSPGRYRLPKSAGNAQVGQNFKRDKIFTKKKSVKSYT
ncbi:hypothetical protein OUZ56_023813 [Daphnia magna]|uniref:Uncharacterized protein n=1 Tax=Daphnia magna TaxID=35525 RepID=A0ABR0AZS6_9CRUS|nr:hypothetical protein OUZ56_023813 [Daphnia magna]